MGIPPDVRLTDYRLVLGMEAFVRPNPVRVLFWGLRALAVLGLFFEFMVAGTVLNQVSAIFALTLIMSFVAERNLMARLQLYVGAPPGTDAGSTPLGLAKTAPS